MKNILRRRRKTDIGIFLKKQGLFMPQESQKKKRIFPQNGLEVWFLQRLNMNSVVD